MMNHIPNPTAESTYDAVIVTGDRYALHSDWRLVVELAFREYLQPTHGLLIHGAARGVDTIADDVYRQSDRWTNIEKFPADWNTHGRAAGPKRNQQMLDRLIGTEIDGARVAVLAFHNDLANSKGTKHMVSIARKAGVPVHVFTTKGEVTA